MTGAKQNHSQTAARGLYCCVRLALFVSPLCTMEWTPASSFMMWSLLSLHQHRHTSLLFADTGNEGPITAFWAANGFMVEYLAPKWGAMLVFPEERYYGTSLPFGDASFQAENLKYLTTEQILEDYVELIAHLKTTIAKAADCPVVAFGGSYGGTLTTFLRAKYPATVIGGLASSAPIGYYDKEGWATHGVDEFTWSDIVTRDYAEAHPLCLSQISSAMAAIESTPVSDLIRAFGVCAASGLGLNAHTELFAYALESQPQLDYPYPVGALPAWPVNATCRDLVAAGSSKTKLVAAAADITAKVIGKPPNGCLPTLTEGPGEVPGDGPGDDSAWGWQSCTENLHQFSARGPVRSYTCALSSPRFSQHQVGIDPSVRVQL